MTRKRVFSEGRTLCARIVRPHGLQGISPPPVDGREAGGFMRIPAGWAQALVAGVRSPSIQGVVGRGTWPYGKALKGAHFPLQTCL